jgi:septal ring factor EnvC (AmiA/AmiB activator)
MFGPAFRTQPVDTGGKAPLGCSSEIDEDPMIGRMILVASLLMVSCVLMSARAGAQDVPGIEICTVEKTMERRTSCLQSNVDFLQKTITKLSLDHQQKLDAAKAQIESLKSTVAGLQKIVDDLQSAQKKDKEQKAMPPAKDGASPVKDGAK